MKFGKMLILKSILTLISVLNPVKDSFIFTSSSYLWKQGFPQWWQILPLLRMTKTFVRSVSGRNSRLEAWLAPAIHQSEWSNHQGVRHCMCLWVFAIVLTDNECTFLPGKKRDYQSLGWPSPDECLKLRWVELTAIVSTWLAVSSKNIEWVS